MIKPPGSVLYISYDGILEPLGEGQVLAYLEPIAKEFSIFLISFEKSDDQLKNEKPDAIARRVKSNGISWFPLKYHKSPTVLATTWDIFAGVVLSLFLCIKHKISIIHARSYVAAMIALIAKKICKTKFIFDMRGFWADERVDGGIWPANSALYRAAKYCEKLFLLHADHVIFLSNAGLKEASKFPYVSTPLQASVIPTCADFSKFYPPLNNFRAEPIVLGYVGSVGTWYLFDEVIRTFKLLLEVAPNARLLIVNRNEHPQIRRKLDQHLVSSECYTLLAASHSKVPEHIRAMHLGVYYIKPAYSKIACAPTKLAEFLGSGVPCITNGGIGDIDDILANTGVGVLVDNFEQQTLATAVDQALALLSDVDTTRRCLFVAESNFSLQIGVEKYISVYKKLIYTS
jgi:glycosyltransferase involved in cell wall biosynthesis